MRYLIVDAKLRGTGLRDEFNDSLLCPKDLNLSNVLIHKIKEWVKEYDKQYYEGFKDSVRIDELDNEGRLIARLIKRELQNVKMQYFSAATMKREIIE